MWQTPNSEIDRNEGTMDAKQIGEWTRTIRRAKEEIGLLRGDVAALSVLARWIHPSALGEFRDRHPVLGDRIARIIFETEKSC